MTKGRDNLKPVKRSPAERCSVITVDTQTRTRLHSEN